MFSRTVLFESSAQTNWRHDRHRFPLFGFLAHMYGLSGEAFGLFQKFRFSVKIETQKMEGSLTHDVNMVITARKKSKSIFINN
jgi:hypothetical protein